MRRLFVVIALLGIMLVMRSFQTHVDAPDKVITLAAIGFVVLTTFAVADMGTRLSLPRVTGFILTGVALGPSAANILSAEVVTEMRMFNTLALGLIATSAGLELNLKALLPLLKTLSTTTATKVLLGAPLVGLTLFGMAHLVDLGVPTFEGRAALAVIMGVLSIGTSPSIALAILTETRSKGRLSDLVLGAAVFKDLVVVVCLAVGVAVSLALLNPSASTDSSVLLHVAWELGGSLIAGAVLGAILIAYIRFIQAEMLLFVAAMILVVAELCRVFHLELLLVFISAGFVVRNFSHHEHDLMKPLELVALPVFVVFFTISGASLQLATTWSILPAALAVCVVRAGIYWVAGWVGATLGKESSIVRQNAWFAYLPQAGVTLGLVGLAAEKVPALSAQITTTGMAIVAINLLVGPITLRLALSRAGEIPGSGAALGGATVTPRPTVQQTAARLSTIPQVEPLPEELLMLVAELRRTTVASLHELVLANPPKPAPWDPGEEPNHDLRLEVVHLYRKASKAWYENWVEQLAQLPLRVTVPQSLESLMPRSTDTRLRRLRLWGLRIQWRLSKRGRVRVVPVRLCARVTMEATIAKVAAHYYESAIERYFGASSVDLQPHLTIPEKWQTSLDGAFEDFTHLLETANGPRMSRRALRFSEVEPTIRVELAPLDETRAEFYVTRVSAVWGTEVAKHHLGALRDVAMGALDVHLSNPARDLVDRLHPAVRELTSELRALLNSLESLDKQPPTSATWRERLVDTRQRAVDELARGLRASIVMRELNAVLRANIEKLPTDLRCYQFPTDGDSRGGTIRKLNLLEIAETHLVKRLIPVLDQSVRSLSNTFAHLPRDVRDTLEPTLARLEAEDAIVSPGLMDQVRATITRLDYLQQNASTEVETTLDHQRATLLGALSGLEREVTTAQFLGETTTHRLRQWISRLGHRLKPLLDWGTTKSSLTPEDDARGTLLALHEWLRPAASDVVAGWFSQQAVRDERIYSDEADLLDRVLEAESRWREGEFASLLIRGEPGSGKTSLLNMCELELRSPRVFRLDAEGPEQSRGLNEALAGALGCRPTETSITYALALQRPILLVDNLYTWLARSRDPIAQLNQLLILISRTSEAFWIVVIDPALQQRVSPFIAVQTAFAAVIDIPQVTRKDLEAMVLSRAQRAKQSVHFKPTSLGRVLRRLGLPGDELLFFILLSRASGGSPGRALSLALMSATGGDGNLEFDINRLSPAAPRLGDHLSASQLAILMTILQHGSLDLVNIALQVGLAPTEAELDVAFLRSSGLLRAQSRSYEIPDGVRWVVADELSRIGALNARGERSQQEALQRKTLFWVATVSFALIGFYTWTKWVNEPSWSHWAWLLAALGVLLLPAVQNVTSGLLLRWFTGVRVGDHVRAGNTSGTVQRVGIMHLRVLDGQDTAVLLPHRSLLARRMILQRGTLHGAPLRVLVAPRGHEPVASHLVFRAAHLCPYRIPGSPIVVRHTGDTTSVELHSWHRHSARPVEEFLVSRLSSVPHSEKAPRTSAGL